VYENLDSPIIDYLLKPTRIYVKEILNLLKYIDIKGISHITGGGFYENIPRSIKDGFCAKIYKDKIIIPQVFKTIQKEGNLDEETMFNTFNQGVGLTLIIDKKYKDIVQKNIEDSYVIGEIVCGEEKLILC